MNDEFIFKSLPHCCNSCLLLVHALACVRWLLVFNVISLGLFKCVLCHSLIHDSQLISQPKEHNFDRYLDLSSKHYCCFVSTPYP